MTTISVTHASEMLGRPRFEVLRWCHEGRLTLHVTASRHNRERLRLDLDEFTAFVEAHAA